MSFYASALVYAALTAILFRNLLPDITTHLSSDLGDPLIVTSILAWSSMHVPITDAWWNFPAFAPLQGVTAFTEHFLLTYPVASPIIWLTGNPVLAYNIVFLLVWPLNALASYALAREVTGSPSAAFIGGLAFGFAPYLSDHLSHLQLLLAFGMPVGLLGLHRYLRTRRWTDAAVFGAGWLATALANAYTLVFFPILVVLWCVWFLRPSEWRSLAALLVAALVASIPLIPLLSGYQVRQAAFGLVRSYAEAKTFAADMTALIGVSHREWLWAGWLPNTYGESSLFPGFTIIGLALYALFSRRVPTGEPGGLVPRVIIAVAAVTIAIVLARIWTGPSAWHLGSVALPPFLPYELFTFAVVFLIVAILATTRFRARWMQRNVGMFYAVAAVVFWLFALGPEPTWAGEPILTSGPYRLFFDLHVPAVVRAPARAWIAVLPCLSVLAAFGTKVLLGRIPRHRSVVLAAVAGLIAAEGWFVEGTRAVPWLMPPGAIPQGATVLDVPLSDPFLNAAAQYRAVIGGYRTINGYSGYQAPHFVRLQVAFAESQYDAIDEYRRLTDLYVILRSEADGSFRRWMMSQRADSQSEIAGAIVYRLPRLDISAATSAP